MKIAYILPSHCPEISEEKGMHASMERLSKEKGKLSSYAYIGLSRSHKRMGN